MHLFFALALSFCPPAKGPVLPADATQLIVGIAPEWGARTATLYRFERRKGKKWKGVGDAWAANLGWKGLAAGRGLLAWCGPEKDRKIEGDWKAPAGVFPLGQRYGFGEVLETMPKGALTPITETMACVSDPESRYYNRIVDEAKVERDWEWSRPLKRADGRKSRTIMIGVNGADDPARKKPLPREGSCILFHVERPGKGTVGCTSLPVDRMDALIRWVTPKRKPVYVLMTREQYEALRLVKGSGLPALPEEGAP